jgi:hemolysin III
MIALYTMSSIYHGLTSPMAKKVFQIMDHCSIFILIAGTYTPIMLSAVRPAQPVTGWAVIGFVWGLSVLGIVLNAILPGNDFQFGQSEHSDSAGNLGKY